MTPTATATKQILISTIGQETKREIAVDLEPDALVTDVLEQVGLLGFRLSDPRGGNFNPGDRIFDKVEDGQKVFAAKVDDLSAGT